MSCNTAPEPQHHWLRQLVGDWTFDAECVMGPDQPASKLSGIESIRSLGDLWIIAEGKGEMPGGGLMESRMTLGFDPAKNKFVGTWIGSVMANLFVYEGELDPARKVLPLYTTGPSFADPTKLATYQDVIQIESASRRLLWSQTQGDDGAWTRFMTSTYSRVG